MTCAITVKAVKTDLAWELLRIMAQNDPDLADILEIKGQDWKSLLAHES